MSLKGGSHDQAGVKEIQFPVLSNGHLPGLFGEARETRKCDSRFSDSAAALESAANSSTCPITLTTIQPSDCIRAQQGFNFLKDEVFYDRPQRLIGRHCDAPYTARHLGKYGADIICTLSHIIKAGWLVEIGDEFQPSSTRYTRTCRPRFWRWRACFSNSGRNWDGPAWIRYTATRPRVRFCVPQAASRQKLRRYGNVR